MATPSPANVLQFLRLCGKLKATRRTGWVNHRVNQPESIADHMYRMGMMAMLLPKTEDIDREKCIKMAIVHDLAESIVGDITPDDPVPKEEKERRERSAMLHIYQDILDGSSEGKEMYDLWEEYESAATKEAQFVKDIDKFDMVLQAFEYEQADNRPKELQAFFNSTAGKFKTSLVRSWVSELEAQRGK